MVDLRVRQFFGRPDQAVACVADHNIDPPQAAEGLIDQFAQAAGGPDPY